MLVRHLSRGELIEYADGGMTGTKRRWAQGHLSRCEWCTRALEANWEAAGALRAVPTAPVPGDLRQRITARIPADAIRPLSCRTARQLIQEGLDRALPPLSAGLLRLHLDDCPACWQEQRTLRAATRLVRSAEILPAPAGLWEKALAGRRPHPAVSWGVRLRPVAAAAAMAAGAIVLVLHSQPQHNQIVPVRSRQVASRPTNVTPAPVTPDSSPQPVAAVNEEPVAPARIETTLASASQSAAKPAVAAALARRSGAVRAAVVRTEPPAAPAVISLTTSHPDEAAPKREVAAAPPRRSRGLQALAMMAKAVASDREGRVSRASELEPWQVFGDEAVSEAPLATARPDHSPGADSSDSPAQPGTGASGSRPSFAGRALEHAA